MPEKRFIGVKELAKYLDIIVNTVYYWTFSRQIPYHKLGKLVKFDLHKIGIWLKEREVKPL